MVAASQIGVPERHETRRGSVHRLCSQRETRAGLRCLAHGHNALHAYVRFAMDSLSPSAGRYDATLSALFLPSPSLSFPRRVALSCPSPLVFWPLALLLSAPLPNGPGHASISTCRSFARPTERQASDINCRNREARAFRDTRGDPGGGAIDRRLVPACWLQAAQKQAAKRSKRFSPVSQSARRAVLCGVVPPTTPPVHINALSAATRLVVQPPAPPLQSRSACRRVARPILPPMTRPPIVSAIGRGCHRGLHVQQPRLDMLSIDSIQCLGHVRPSLLRHDKSLQAITSLTEGTPKIPDPLSRRSGLHRGPG